jgi:hypothetical protein
MFAVSLSWSGGRRKEYCARCFMHVILITSKATLWGAGCHSCSFADTAKITQLWTKHSWNWTHGGWIQALSFALHWAVSPERLTHKVFKRTGRRSIAPLGSILWKTIREELSALGAMGTEWGNLYIHLGIIDKVGMFLWCPSPTSLPIQLPRKAGSYCGARVAG